MRRKSISVAAALMLSGCAGSELTSASEHILTDESGKLVLEYRNVEIPLMVLIEMPGGQAMRPSGPPSSYTMSQVTDYWIGATSEAMKRCGYVELRQQLKNKSHDRSAFAQGENKLGGSVMVNCGKARRLAEAILSH
ncbi:MAG: hypothetical protein P8X75_11195 [Limibacillus sp.]|jgi:hypothetical protein